MSILGENATGFGVPTWENEMTIQKVSNGFLVTMRPHPLQGTGGSNVSIHKTMDELLLFVRERMEDKK